MNTAMAYEEQKKIIKTALIYRISVCKQDKRKSKTIAMLCNRIEVASSSVMNIKP